MKILITGGSGFIGSNLIPLLMSSGHEVCCILRKYENHNSTLQVIGDLSDPDSYRSQILSFRPDCTIHLAWEGLPDYSFYYCRKNLQIGLDLLQILHECGCKKIFIAGTCWEYGNLTGQVAEHEEGDQLTLFASFKKALLSVARSYLAEDVQFIWGRIFFVYGPGQRSTSLIPSCYRSLVEGNRPIINNPLLSNDLIHISDVVNAINSLVISGNSKGVYNIGTGISVPVVDIVNSVALHMGLPQIYENQSSLPVRGLSADISRLQELGWKPTVQIEDGIKNTISTWRPK